MNIPRMSITSQTLACEVGPISEKSMADVGDFKASIRQKVLKPQERSFGIRNIQRFLGLSTSKVAGYQQKDWTGLSEDYEDS